MAATIAGSYKAHFEGLGLGLAVSRYVADTTSDYPRLIITDAIAIVSAQMGDVGDDDAVVETVQFDLYQRWRHADRSVAESTTLASRVEAEVRRAPLDDLPFRVHGTRPVSRTKRLDEANNIVRDIITVDIGRDQLQRG